MRYMVLVKASEQSEAGEMPTREMLEEMGRFNDELIKAGVLLAADGLHPTSKGLRLRFDGGKPTVIDGPFAETKELLAGYWVVQVSSREEAVQWFSRAPFGGGIEIELRPVFEASDFPEHVLPAEAAAREQALRDANQQPVQPRQ